MDGSTRANTPGETRSGAGEQTGWFTLVLEPGEKVLWDGQPCPMRGMRAKSAHALFGTVIPILFLVTPLRSLQISLLQPFASDQNIVRSAIGIVFLLIAMYGLLSPLVAYRRARRTRYAVTDRRLLRFLGEVPDAVMRLEEVESMTLRAMEDSTGDVLFSSRPAYDQDVSLHPLRGFFGVSDAELVHRTINEAREGRMRERQHAVQDYIELLLQGKRPEDLFRR